MADTSPAAHEPLSSDDPTLDQPSPDPSPAEVELVEGSTPHLSGETESLLRYRLRAAGILLCVGAGIFLVLRALWSTTPRDLHPDHVACQRWLGWFHLALVIVLAVASAMLCRRCRFSQRTLRAFEIVIFGSTAVFFMFLQNFGAVAAATRPAGAYFPSPTSPWLVLLYTYAVFIPNTLRRASIVIGAMAAAPLAVMLFGSLRFDAVGELVGFRQWSGVAALMGITAVTAVYGSHMIGNLRREAFKARRLGQYHLRKQIGSGGMGEVYLAEHQLLKRPCALKLIRPGKAADPKVLARFEREVQATAQLSHFNTVDIYDYGRTADGTFYYVMEYLPGLSLAELVARYGPLPPERAVHLLQQTCGALAEAHEAGLIHRDIKPGNIIACRRGGLYDVAKLLDFGLVKPLVDAESVELTQQGMVTGSPRFMSPEQAHGDGRPDARSDIYSLGAVAYFVLTGEPPFREENVVKLLVAHAKDEVRAPSEIRPEIPADVEGLVLRCLAKRPEERFASARELEEALAACNAARLWTRARAADWWQQRQETTAVGAA